ncbi:hypothetical protein B5F09_10935 [Erysipelatoclostridium sp. An173]|uniref:glycosyltransferase n=1 Tax=Erysipelatoclostridium sp. An173 TaxID=1965571 RepID=UPI000B3891D0|nr:glycosyltransferase [Erysipelatoclostridium sp. An173]OUP73979.1 hypothetical protein B5F09_10935 [Erysipelatoclostridium sp. An173]
MPRVSIVMPNYNGAQYIKESIDSVLNQTYKDYELIIIDDCSTDNSKEIINSFSDSRIIKIFSEKNRHVAYTANLGFKSAKGEYIARIDSDDVWENDKLEKQVKYMDENPECGACFTRVNIIDENSKKANEKYPDIDFLFNHEENKSSKEWIHYFFEKGNCLCNPSALIRTNILDKVGRNYNVACVPAQDFDMWVRLVIKAPIYILEERLTNYRWTNSEDKISGNDASSEIAFYNIHTLIRKNIFDYMTDQEFKEYFSDFFKNSNSSSKIELEIEKALILLRFSDISSMRWLALEKFEKLLKYPECVEVLETKYNFNLKEFYKLYRVSSFNDIAVLKTSSMLKEENMCLKNDIENYKLKLNEYSEELTKIVNSTSWKLTKPLRKVMSILSHK